MSERLQNILSHRGVASRRHAAELIAAGRVAVNGAAVTEPGFRVDAEKDVVAVDGKELPRGVEAHRTIMMYKPVGVLSAANDPFGEKTACDLIKDNIPERLVPVGRLDKDSEGLLLLSNDGDLVLKLTHPRYGHVKTYVARVAGRWAEDKLTVLRSPLEIDGYKIRPCHVELISKGADNTHDLLFRLGEGRNRQIRRMCSCAHLVVLALKRVQVGPLTLGDLKPGEWRDLTPEEIKSLLAAGETESPAPGGNDAAPRGTSFQNYAARSNRPGGGHQGRHGRFGGPRFEGHQTTAWPHRPTPRSADAGPDGPVERW